MNERIGSAGDTPAKRVKNTRLPYSGPSLEEKGAIPLFLSVTHAFKEPTHALITKETRVGGAGGGEDRRRRRNRIVLQPVDHGLTQPV